MESATPKFTERVLPPLPTGWRLVAAEALANGNLALLATSSPADGWLRDPGAEGRLWCFDGADWVEGPTFALEATVPHIDRFAAGPWLVVGTRTQSEPNARVLAPDGKLLARFMLGDGVAHVGVDQRDRIWVGWFDEGVFGNDSWLIPGEEWPPSRNGVGCFTADGHPVSLSALPAGIADCYALNVFDDEAWACPYVDFPLLQL